jgi:hypothetical protein
MKQLLFLLLSSTISLLVTAQTISVTFSGTNKNKNYQVILDGTSYYSNSNIDAGNSNASVKKEITLANQLLGAHTIKVYRVRANNTNNTANNGNAIYSKTFELRQGYDMMIKIAGAGTVTFTEKRVRAGANTSQSVQLMTTTKFNQLVRSVTGTRTQATRFNTVRNAFASTSNYFTTAQVRQLLLLINNDANRLTLAKSVYARVTDPANITALNDVFNRTASRDEMNVFIRNNPNINGTYNNGVGNTTGSDGFRTAMADYQFSQLLQSVNNQYSQSSRYTAVYNVFNTTVNYFSSAQVRQMLSLIGAENDRLALAKLAYPRLADAANFAVVYDLFNNQSYRNELMNFAVQNGGTAVGSTTTTNRTAMGDTEFTAVLREARNHFLPWDIVRDVKAAFSTTGNYFNTSQIRQLLSIVGGQGDRLELAKLSWNTVSDPANFTTLYDLFATQASKDELNSYIVAHPM